MDSKLFVQIERVRFSLAQDDVVNVMIVNPDSFLCCYADPRISTNALLRPTFQILKRDVTEIHYRSLPVYE